MRVVPATTEGIAEAADAIREGLVVAYPTDTVYGLGADPFSVVALERLYVCKGRPQNAPLLLVAADLDQVAEVVEVMDPAARRYAEQFWPGPLSLLLPKSGKVPAMVTAGNPKVCVRVPDHATTRALCTAVGHPIVSTSANVSGAPPARSLDDLALPGIALGIDGGALPDQPPSTIFDPESGAVLREGSITADMLTDAAAD